MHACPSLTAGDPTLLDSDANSGSMSLASASATAAQLFSNMQLTVAGWGATSGGGLSPTLQSTLVCVCVCVGGQALHTSARCNQSFWSDHCIEHRLLHVAPAMEPSAAELTCQSLNPLLGHVVSDGI